jgi:hypothetical protein
MCEAVFLGGLFGGRTWDWAVQSGRAVRRDWTFDVGCEVEPRLRLIWLRRDDGLHERVLLRRQESLDVREEWLLRKGLVESLRLVLRLKVLSLGLSWNLIPRRTLEQRLTVILGLDGTLGLSVVLNLGWKLVSVQDPRLKLIELLRLRLNLLNTLRSSLALLLILLQDPISTINSRRPRGRRKSGRRRPSLFHVARLAQRHCRRKVILLEKFRRSTKSIKMLLRIDKVVEEIHICQVDF